MNLATEVGLSTLRVYQPIHLPVRHVHALARYLTRDELDRLTIIPSSNNPASDLWVVLRLGHPR